MKNKVEDSACPETETAVATVASGDFKGPAEGFIPTHRKRNRRSGASRAQPAAEHTGGGSEARTSGWARTRRERHGYPVRENGAYSGTTGSVGDAMAGAAHRSDKPDEVAELTTRSLRARGGGKG